MRGKEEEEGGGSPDSTCCCHRQPRGHRENIERRKTSVMVKFCYTIKLDLETLAASTTVWQDTKGNMVYRDGRIKM